MMSKLLHDDLLGFDLTIKKREIDSFMSQVRQDRNSYCLTSRDLDLIEEVIQIALCYAIDLEKYGITDDELELTGSLIMDDMMSPGIVKYEMVFSMINLYRLERSRWKS
ncbi:MAG: hypothetical protein PHW52_02430 [Candidatus Pacebacteria bacterium]|nr:hypothetical protein [Candidatus Paceibacterota bacterium]